MSSPSSPRALAVRSLERVVYGGFPAPDGAFRHSVLWADEGSAVAREALAAGGPCLIARFGSTELACVNFYTRWRLGKGARIPYLKQVRRAIQVNSGVFPTDDASLDRFCEIYLDAMPEADVMGVWFNHNEDRIVQRFCPAAKLVHLEALNAVIRAEPWTMELAGKSVLVVHPFARSIERQYRDNRELLFGNPLTLPEFELSTLPAVQSLAGTECGHSSWFDALESMKQQIAAIDFDVAIVGAGAYGLPLGAAVKRMGRQAVHLGGATQLLFGIIGRRWEVESPEDVATLVNEYWVRPSAEETPQGAGLVEGGCYW